jgi:diguanylate cyclase (GGDEF)-like protein
VLFPDLDGLKYVNDTYGHLAGDRLIVTSVERIRTALRPSDLLARIGGDELVVLLEDLDRPEDASAVAQRILDSLAEPFHADRNLIRPSASIGIAHTDDPETKGAALIAHADSAMYQAKRAKRGRFEVFSADRYASDRADAAAAEQLAGELPAAIRGGELEVHFQPILDLADPGGPMYAVEALVRWPHPRRGMLTAGGFVDIAERNGLLPELGLWVIDAACTQLAAWDREHPERAPRRLFVNLSTVELVESGLPDGIRRSLDRAGVDADRLTIEITETGLLHDVELAGGALWPLRQMGCELAIDDFGTGYSSLSRLIDIPASVIKIDQAFTRQLGRDDNAAAIIASVHNLGRTLGRTVVAEGVEDEETLTQLRRLGIRYAQGYHLGVPATADELAARWDGTASPG